MFDVLQRFGSQRSEVRFFLRHERPPGRDIGRQHSVGHNKDLNVDFMHWRGWGEVVCDQGQVI